MVGIKSNLRIHVAGWILSILLVTSPAMSQQVESEGEEAAYSAGSIALSTLYFPIKLTTCLGTQMGSAVAYIFTYGVPGNFDGGTNGKQIGEEVKSLGARAPDQRRDIVGNALGGVTRIFSGPGRVRAAWIRHKPLPGVSGRPIAAEPAPFCSRTDMIRVQYF